MAANTGDRNALAEVIPGLSRAQLNEQLLRTLTQNVPMALWVIDREGTYVHQQGEMLSPDGSAPWLHVGENLFALYTPEQSEAARRALAGEVVHLFADLHDITWENWLVPLRGEDGEILGVVGFALDVSRARRAERELREQLDVVQRQQQVIRDLSTPIIEVWDGVLTLPMIGVVDSLRTSDVMSELLSEIVRTQARYAILDLTGVDMIDTRVASHLINMIRAIRLLGADGIVTGIQPSVAQTVVALGLDLSSVTTHANLKAALKFCIQVMAREADPEPDAGPGGLQRGAPRGRRLTSP